MKKIFILNLLLFMAVNLSFSQQNSTAAKSSSVQQKTPAPTATIASLAKEINELKQLCLKQQEEIDELKQLCKQQENKLAMFVLEFTRCLLQSFDYDFKYTSVSGLMDAIFKDVRENSYYWRNTWKHISLHYIK